MCFIRFCEKLKLFSYKDIIFVVKMQCVFYKAGAERLNSAQTNLMLQRFGEITNA